MSHLQEIVNPNNQRSLSLTETGTTPFSLIDHPIVVCFTTLRPLFCILYLSLILDSVETLSRRLYRRRKITCVSQNSLVVLDKDQNVSRRLWRLVLGHTGFPSVNKEG